jgi:hypothetical protein
MRKALRPNPQRRMVSSTIQVKAPVLGLTTESPVNAPPGTALIMTNWFPEVDRVRVRLGHIAHATDMLGDVSTIMAYTSASASKMFAATDSDIFDVTDSGPVGTSAVSGLNNGMWQQIMFATSGGQFLVICNGADDVRIYNGTTWTTPVITGAISSTFINLMNHQKRLWFVPVNSMTIYYLPVESIAGAAVAFPVGALFRKGGFVMALGTWTRDSGAGMDDLLTIVTSEGEVAVYQGIDPSSSTTWSLIGVFHMGKPIGRRCIIEVGGDLAILTEDGVVPMSQAIQTEQGAIQSIALTRNIQQAFIAAVQRGGEVFGWQILSFPKKNMAILNIPAAGSQPTQQFPFNTLTGAWGGPFIGMNAICWGVFETSLYFGGTGAVYRAEYGASDNGEAIVAAMLPAFMDLKASGQLKMVHAVRPIFTTDITDLVPSIAIAVDYVTPTDISATEDISQDHLFTWDESIWGGPDIWSGTRVTLAWRGNGNIGTVVSPYIFMSIDAEASTDGDFTWDVSFWDGPDTWSSLPVTEFKFDLTAFDIVYERGGVI